MAAYYTHRHVELDGIGCGKKKVLKPPGGGSSNIFGSSDPSDKAPVNGTKKYGSSDEAEHNNRDGHHLKGASMLVDSVDGASVSSQASSTETPDNSEPNTPRSGTPLLNGPVAYDNHSQVLPTPSRPQGRRAHGGNPVTGVGYGEEAEKKETPRRQRVPPGGYSSKLW